MLSLGYLYAKFVKKYLRGKCVRNSNIHTTAVVPSGCEIYSSSLGRYSYLGYDARVVNCEIGSFCSIADCFTAGSAEHPMEWASTSPVFENVEHSGPKKRFTKLDVPKAMKTIIGHDVWIGTHVVVKQGVHIGNGAVIGSGAVVTKDVPPYAIVGGVPAKVIRYRFSEDVRSALESSSWWLLSDDELSQVAHTVKDPMKFVEVLQNLKKTNYMMSTHKKQYLPQRCNDITMCGKISGGGGANR